MALYVVERDLNNVPPMQLRLDQQDVASACIQLKSQGKRIRYISSAVVPANGRALDLFGADSAEVVREAHSAAGVDYARIVEILDLTPSFVHRDISRSRRSLQRTAGTPTAAGSAKEISHAMTKDSSPELARWLADGQRLFRVCLEALEGSERLQTRNRMLESENEMLREEVARLQRKVDMLQAEHAEMVATFNDLAGHVTQVVDQILQKAEDGENGKSEADSM
jgi:hypothetical protein